MVTNTSGGTDVGSLRWALSHVTGGEVIRFEPSLAGKTIILEATAGTNQSVTIEGPAGQGITISGGGTLNRVLAFPGSDDKTAVLRNLTITGGNDGSVGGSGIYAANTTLVVENSTITGNGNDDGGPAIYGWNITLINTTVSGNKVTPAFPFAAVIGNAVRLINSTVACNASGGVSSYGTVQLVVLRNSVISDNTRGSNCSSENLVREGRT